MRCIARVQQERCTGSRCIELSSFGTDTESKGIETKGHVRL